MKTRLRAFLALFLCAALLLPGFAAAAETYPESPHPYQNGVTDVCTYTCPGADRGVFVTFSEDTWVQPYETRIVTVTPGHDEFTVGDLISHWVRTGDYIAVLDGARRTVGTYSGDGLAGRTVYVPTASFEILLNADADVNGYGYRVTEVRAATKNEVRKITYHAGVDGITQSVLCSRTADAVFWDECDFDASYVTRDGFAFSGWSAVPGGNVVYDAGAAVPEGAGDLHLWAVWTPLRLKSDEVLSISNSAWYFERDGRENYYMTAEDYRAMQLNLYRTYGLGPVPSPVLSVVLATYPDWEWQGSCYGLSTVVALQHLGMIDLFKLQPEAETVSDLRADDALISRVNYYQSQAATSWLTENKAYVPGAPDYAAQLRRLYESVAAGNLVLFTFYPGQPFITTGHTVLFTGAYARADGSRVLICYDCNDAWAYLREDYDSRFVISADFTSMEGDWYEVEAFNWTDDFTQFGPFDADGEGSSPLNWYQALLRHILDIFATLRRIFAK